jgi:two-component system sensor histidine kinase/response regulator
MKYKIMIVDDEPVNLRTLERLFRSDYHVVTAPNGAEALALLQHHDVALLISDQRMPEMTGIELMKRTVALRPQMVKLLLTGYTDVSALIESINCGLVYRYLTKPWDNDDLRLTVNRALEHYEMVKSRHLLGMENQRLRARLDEIHALATLEIADDSALQNVPEFDFLTDQEEIYELPS